MLLNATCIVQIVNFIITYLVLRKVLLAPFVAIMHKKLAVERKRAAQLAEGEAAIGQLTTDKVVQLADFQQRINSTYQQPVITTPTLPELPTNLAVLQATPQLVSKAAQLLIEKIPHVA